MIMNEKSSNRTEITITEFARRINKSREGNMNYKPDFVISNGENMIVMEMRLHSDDNMLGILKGGDFK